MSQNIKWKDPDAKEYIWFDSISITFKTGKAIEVRIMIPLKGEEW